ncbi:MAG: putative selenium-dependent hydroxylase accessory protein YqeC, partial [Clostridia bacterium]|nr:putative selenium-dependent hydroxylase accessory protein YqeC [Clostridia bacterium]
ARELAKAGHTVIVSTTTHIFPPDGIATSNPETIKEAKAALEQNSLVCFGKPAELGKLSAPILLPQELEQLADYVLIEADGAKRLPLKAPAEHEPVIPPQTRLVIAVAGLDGAGRPIRETAFRSARYATLCGKAEDDLVSAVDIACVLAHPLGQQKNVLNDMRFAVLLNKADDEARRGVALQIAGRLNQQSVERVVIAALGK